MYCIILEAFVTLAAKVKNSVKSPFPHVNPGCCCHVVCSRPLQTRAKKPQVSLSCLQAGLWLLSPWKACGGCSWGDMTITKSAHVHSTASSHPRLPVHIRTSEEGVSLSLNCLSWGFLLCFLWLTIIVFVFLSDSVVGLCWLCCFHPAYFMFLWHAQDVLNSGSNTWRGRTGGGFPVFT